MFVFSAEPDFSQHISLYFYSWEHQNLEQVKEQRNGRGEISRREDGVGSQFTFYLPVWNISPRQTFPSRVDCRFDKIMILLAPRWQDRNKRGVTLPFPCRPSHFQIVLFRVNQDVIFLAALRNAILEPKNPKFLHRNTRWMFGHIKFYFSRLCGCMYAFTYIYTYMCVYI